MVLYSSLSSGVIFRTWDTPQAPERVTHLRHPSE